MEVQLADRQQEGHVLVVMEQEKEQIKSRILQTTLVGTILYIVVRVVEQCLHILTIDQYAELVMEKDM